MKSKVDVFQNLEINAWVWVGPTEQWDNKTKLKEFETLSHIGPTLPQGWLTCWSIDACGGGGGGGGGVSVNQAQHVRSFPRFPSC